MRDWTADEIKEALRRRHGCNRGNGEWVCVEEAFSGWATAGGGIDLLAIGAWQTAKAPGLPGAGKAATYPVVAYEVKVSRSDFRRELYGVTPPTRTRKHFDGSTYEWTDHRRARPGWPHKAQAALDASHYFMFAIPDGLLKPEEIIRREQPAKPGELWVPPEAGLVAVNATGCHVVHPAPRRDEPKPLTRHAAAELIRHAVDPNGLRRARERIAYLENQVQQLNASLASMEEIAA